MSKFVISPHFRLQEWVAEEKGYFKAEGLDYEFRDNYGPGDAAKKHATPNRIGAYQSIEEGRACDVSGACHWTVNVAASTGHGTLYADAYSVAPCGVFVPPESDIKHPSELKGVPISVGYQSGSHYSTIQGLEQYMRLDDIELSFADGLLFSRLEKLIDRKVPAASLFSGPYYFLEQLGFRKVIDTTFMMATSTCVRSCTRITTGRNSRRASSTRWTRAAGARASASSSSPTRRKCSRNPSAGSPSAAFSPKATWARASTKTRSSRSRCSCHHPLAALASLSRLAGEGWGEGARPPRNSSRRPPAASDPRRRASPPPGSSSVSSWHRPGCNRCRKSTRPCCPTDRGCSGRSSSR